MATKFKTLVHPLVNIQEAFKIDEKVRKTQKKKHGKPLDKLTL